MNFTRRNFMKSGAAATLVAGVQPGVWAGTSAAREVSGRPRNVIVLASDGMSSGTLSFTDQFLRWRDGRPSHWLALYGQGGVQRGLMDTASRNNIVTDSAAAASAWGCGYRVNNGSLNMGPEGEVYEPILVSARRAGKATGLITTATITHATPAGFAANVEQRGDEPAIALQYLEREIDLLLGGGLRHFEARRRTDGRDVRADYQAAGYAYAANTTELQAGAARADRLLGLFASGHIPYEIDRINDSVLSERVPSLAEMTRAGLDVLRRRTSGFILQVEGARVDHAAHANDASAILFDQIAFDDAIQVAVEFAAEEPDTLVIITTDHGNANPGLSSGQDGGEQNFSALNGFRRSQTELLRQLDAADTPATIQQKIQEASGIPLTDGEARSMQRQLADEWPTAYRRMASHRAVLGQLLANHTDIGWVGDAHTSDHVELAAFGPGSAAVKAFSQNTDLHGLMQQCLT